MDLTGKIAWAHLKEFPDYYTRLDRLEAEADAYWSSQRRPKTVVGLELDWWTDSWRTYSSLTSNIEDATK